MINIYHWTKDWEHCQLEFYGEPFAACDPGKDGAIVLCRPDGTIEESFALSKAPVKRIAQGMERMGISTIIMEDQFMGRNSQTVLDLRLGVGILLARLELHVGTILYGYEEDIILDVVFVMPKVWHAVILPTCQGRKELKAGAEVVVRAGNSVIEVSIPEWTKADLGGFWDAVCIRDWWMHMRGQGEAEDVRED